MDSYLRFGAISAGSVAAILYSKAAAGAGIYGTVGFTAGTLCVKEATDRLMNSILGIDTTQKSETAQDQVIKSLKGAASYLASSGIAGSVVYAGLTYGGVYTTSTAAAIVGTALSVHLVWTLFSKVIGEGEGNAAEEGALIGIALVAGRSLIDRVEVFLGLTPAAAGLTYSVGAGLAALTLGIKHVAVKFFDTIFARPQSEPEKYVEPNSNYPNQYEKVYNDKYDSVLLKRDLVLREVAIDVAGSVAAAVGSYGIVRALDWVSGPTAKLVIGATLITHVALKGIFKITAE